MNLDVEDDYMVFDNLVTLTHQGADDVTVFYDNLTYKRGNNTRPIKNCLIRQVSERIVGAVRQIFERGKSVTNDNIPLVDTVIEIPKKEATVPVEVNDILIDEVNGLKFLVLAVDQATLRSRIRAACRSTA